MTRTVGFRRATLRRKITWYCITLQYQLLLLLEDYFFAAVAVNLFFLPLNGLFLHLTCDVDAEFVFHLAIAVVDHGPVGSLVLLFEALDTEDGLIGGAIGPDFEARIGGQVLESLEKSTFRGRVAPDLQHTVDGLLLAARPFVARLLRELGRSLATGLERRGVPVPRLQ